jgi:hypothetical protein
LLAGTALACAAVANLSGLSKAEVERIWLPFTVWITVLAAGLPALARASASSPGEPAPEVAARHHGGWPPLAVVLLALQVLTAVVVESLVQTPW